MNKRFTFYTGAPTTLELARTDVQWLRGSERPKRMALFTLVDINIGVVLDAMLIDPNAAWEPEFGPFWDWLDDGDQGDDVQKVSLPDTSILTDDELDQITWIAGTDTVRRCAGEPLHPVHDKAIDVLLCFPSRRDVPLRVESDYFDSALHEVKWYSLYEHTFDKNPLVRYRPEANYRQSREGEADDRHASHDFDPWCCGLARLRALQTPPHLVPDHRASAGRTDASNGA